MKNFEIGKQINIIIRDSNIIGNKVFPIVADAGTQFPFCIYRRSGYRPITNKDDYNEIVQIELAILANNYDESVNIANGICEVMNGYSNDIIEDIRITNIFEDFAEDTYIQKIYLDIYLR